MKVGIIAKEPRKGRPTIAERKAAEKLISDLQELLDNEMEPYRVKGAGASGRMKEVVAGIEAYWQTRGVSAREASGWRLKQSLKAAAKEAAALPDWMRAGAQRREET